MKRPLLVVAISYIVGIIIGVYLKIGIPFILLLLLMLSIIKRKNWKIFIIIAVTIIISSIHVIYLNSKYQKIYDTQNDYFNKATVEKNIRGLDGKGW